MSASNLNPVERKVLGALLILSDNDMQLTAGMNDIAEVMGYRSAGGAITFALRALEMKNFITRNHQDYEVLL